MFSEQPIVLSSEQEKQFSFSADPSASGPKKPIKKIIIAIALVLAVAVLVWAVFLIIKKYQAPPAAPTNSATTTPIENNVNNLANLPDLNNPDGTASSSASTTLSNLAIEYLAFIDFYKAPDNNFDVKIEDYTLPINIKKDGMNYYDLSRKLDMESGINNLNNNGFTILENPWQNEVNDFYSIYQRLDDKQIPVLITSDFLIYYYQNTLKSVFKDIESNIFYDNLWLINKELYNLAKNRYETRLASIGDINDSILEGQRLEMAFFAVSLELLKPSTDQIIAQGAIDNKSKFSAADAERFYLTIPPYLKEDVAREVSLIKEGKQNIKSPNLLYKKNYADFTVPNEYKIDAKLNNFYLAVRWLNSTFPLEYKSSTCPACLLDKEDWRLSMIASSLITTDFSSRPDLKNRWAKIYKLMAFFKGLRDEIDYVNYHDTLVTLFGDNYSVDDLFADTNPDAAANLEKLKTQLATHDYDTIQGALSKSDPSVKPVIGFKMLAESYWPNDYIFNRLTSPLVGTYQGPTAKVVGDVTACDYQKTIRRCNGFSLDVVNLIHPLAGNQIFDKNTKYSNYQKEVSGLVAGLNDVSLWHSTNYWSTLSIMKSVLEVDSKKMPIFSGSSDWAAQNLETALGAWTNLQLPLEKFSLTPVFTGQSLGNFSQYNENVYVEPNLSLVNELIATNNMLAQMFTALRLNEELNSAAKNLQDIDNDLKNIRNIVIKELNSEALDEQDSEIITEFAKKFTIDQKTRASRVLSLSSNNKTTIKESLEKIKLKVLVHEAQGNKIISVGPVWDFQESR
jgi:hypothetical protein